MPVGRRDGRDPLARSGLRCHPRAVNAHRPARRPADSAADLVLRGGRVATMDAARTFADALAVRDGRIAAVGADTVVGRWIGPRTRVIDLHGRTVTPGFGDAHVHPVASGIDRLRCDLTGSSGLDEYLATITAYAAANPDQPWIRGSGWSLTDFPRGIPHRGDLDRILPDRPAYLESRDGHTAWVDSKGLELAGISESTPDPPDGRIERDADGRPSGTLQETARDLVRRLFPPETPEFLEAALRLAQAELHGLGVTNWQDADVSTDPEEVAYAALAGRGELTARVVGALEWDDTRGGEQIGELMARRVETTWPHYAPTSVKFFVDGVLENFTGALLEPYLDATGRPTTHRGRSLIEPEALKDHVTRLDALGFQAHIHAVGDRATREALDAVEAARRTNGHSDTRPHIAHIQVIHPDDLGRFRALDVVANAQADWAALEDQLEVLTIPFLGPERAARIYPFGSLLRAGATLAMGSDWSVSTPDPLLQMEVAVNRVSYEHRGEKGAFLPDERLDLIDALAAFTMGSAWVNHLEREIGSIEGGKAADLVVLDRDLFDRGAGAIGEASVVATFIDGVAVHERPELET
jgi:predicted amidohydrolase YtcJ